MTDRTDQAGRPPAERPSAPLVTAITGGGDDADLATSASAVAAPPPSYPGRIARYDVLGVLGAGGMGIVYEAQQHNPRRRVALKVIRPMLVSRAMLRRFETEAEVLGRLEHPGIARVYEAGTADADGTGAAQPFFAMELIRGRRLDEFVKLRRLDLTQRVEILIKLCDAVHHAHQKGVIHRDLKPSNVLVTDDAQPKILDFGVARVTDSDVAVTTMQTDTGQLVGTLQYMSPEQASGTARDIDTRCDVYALGAIAYELLAGRLPHALHEKPLPEALRIIREDEPTRLSTIDRSLAGDLETIVGKALEKEKDRRYASAGELAADLRRYLNDEPIAARPPSTWYQFQKFARRNRALVIGAAAVFLVLLVGLVVSLLLLARATKAEQFAGQQLKAAQLARQAESRQRQEAQNQATALQQVNSFLNEMLSSVDPDKSGGRPVLVANVIDDAAKRLDSGALRDQPQVEASLRTTIGNTYMALGQLPGAEPHLRRALELRKQLNGGSDAEQLAVAAAQAEYAAILWRRNQLADAMSLLELSLETNRRLLGPSNPKVAASIGNIAAILVEQGDYARAEKLGRESLALLRAAPPGAVSPSDIAGTMNGLGDVLYRAGRPAEAEPLHREALSMLRGMSSAAGDDRTEVAQTLDALGTALAAQRKYADAQPVFSEALAIRRRLLGDEHPDVATSLNNLAVCARELKKFDEADPLLSQSIAMREKLLGPEHPALANTIEVLAAVKSDRQLFAEADALFTRALAIRRKSQPATHPQIAQSLAMLGLVELRENKFSDAEKNAREALEIVKHDQTASAGWRGAYIQGLLGAALAGQKRFDDAEPLLVAAADAIKDATRFPPRQREQMLGWIIDLYESTGRPQLAEQWRAKRSATTAPTTAPTKKPL